MKLLLTGTAGRGGWPEPGCPCASCAGARPARRPFGLLIDGVLTYREPTHGESAHGESAHRESAHGESAHGVAAYEVAAQGAPPDGVPFRWVTVPHGYEVHADGMGLTGPDGCRLLYAPVHAEPPQETTAYDVVLIDLLERPERLGALRRAGAVTGRTQVIAIGLDHRIRSEDELDRRLRMWGATTVPDGATLNIRPVHDTPDPTPNTHAAGDTPDPTRSTLGTHPEQDTPGLTGTTPGVRPAGDTRAPANAGETMPDARPAQNTTGLTRTTPGARLAGDTRAPEDPRGTMPDAPDPAARCGMPVPVVGTPARDDFTPGAAPRRALILGGSRSGKSAEAELRMAGEPYVTYVATGPAGAGDAEWAARVRAHRERRPAHWETVETADLAGVIRAAAAPLLVDAVGTWLAAVFDEHAAWDGDRTPVEARCDELVDAWRHARGRIVAVSDEVGMGVVPATASGRAFRDALGRLNERLAAESEDVTLVVAGRPIRL